MIGTAEPRLFPLEAETVQWLDGVMGAVSPARLRATVEALPAPRCRCHWPEAMARTDALVSAALADAGWRVEDQPFACRRIGSDRLGFELGKLDPEGPLRARNVLGIRPGQEGNGAILVGAHHDTVRDTGGADDNGASVAALLELARVLAPHHFRHTVILAAFDMEELGFLGARAMIPRLSQQWRIHGAVVYETMAYTTTAPQSQAIPAGLGALYPGQVARIRARRFAGDWTLVLYRARSQPLACAVAEGLAHLAGRETPILVRDARDLPVLGRVLRMLVPNLLHLSRSDHVPFWEAGLPAIMITDTANFRNPHYHRPGDTPDTLDYARLAAIVGATASAIARLAQLVPAPRS